MMKQEQDNKMHTLHTILRHFFDCHICFTPSELLKSVWLSVLRWNAASLAPCWALCGWIRAADRRDSHINVQQPPIQVFPCTAAGLGTLVSSSLHPHAQCDEQGKGQQAQWVFLESSKGCVHCSFAIRIINLHCPKNNLPFERGPISCTVSTQCSTGYWSGTMSLTSLKATVEIRISWSSWLMNY